MVSVRLFLKWSLTLCTRSRLVHDVVYCSRNLLWYDQLYNNDNNNKTTSYKAQ